MFNPYLGCVNVIMIKKDLTCFTLKKQDKGSRKHFYFLLPLMFSTYSFVKTIQKNLIL